MRACRPLSVSALLVFVLSAHAFSAVPSRLTATHHDRRHTGNANSLVARLPIGLLGNPSSSSTTAINSSADSAKDDGIDDELPNTVTPILLTVLALIISEGIALSTLPLHLQSLGATPVQVGLSTSAFSVAQMVCCPPIVSLSSRPNFGRRKTLSLCLAGAALSSGLIATANTIPLLIFGRFLAGVFAAAIPIAQAGVTDLVPPRLGTLALSRVSAASQTGLVIGPIASAVCQSILKRLGVAQGNLVRGVFVASAAFALFVLSISRAGSDETSDSKDDAKESKGKDTPTAEQVADESKLSLASPVPKQTDLVQPMLRTIALAAGWALTLSVAIYSLFASKFLGYQQSQVSATMSAGAATTILTQIFIVPRLVKRAGEHLSCSLGLWTLALGLAGMSLVRVQPFHIILYLLIRVGSGITDTSTATLVAQNSDGKEEKARNLGMIQSTRAGARIVTPLLSGSLFARSCQQSWMPGSLPYWINSALALFLIPLPLILKRTEKKSKTQYAT